MAFRYIQDLNNEKAKIKPARWGGAGVETANLGQHTLDCKHCVRLCQYLDGSDLNLLLLANFSRISEHIRVRSGGSRDMRHMLQHYAITPSQNKKEWPYLTFCCQWWDVHSMPFCPPWATRRAGHVPTNEWNKRNEMQYATQYIQYYIHYCIILFLKLWEN